MKIILSYCDRNGHLIWNEYVQMNVGHATEQELRIFTKGWLNSNVKKSDRVKVKQINIYTFVTNAKVP